MATRPDALPAKVWAKLNDMQRQYAATAWPAFSDEDKNDILAEYGKNNIKDCVDLLTLGMSEATGKPAAAVEPPANLADMPTDVVDYIKGEAAKVTPELSQFVHETVDMQIENDSRKIILFQKIDEAGLDVPAMDTKPDATANTAAKRLGDVYFVPKFSKKGEALEPQMRHRLHDLADVLFGNGYVKEVNRLNGMGDDAIGEYGKNKHTDELALAKKRLSVLRKKFAEACEAVVSYRGANDLNGINIVVSNSKSPKPFMLQEILGVDKNGIPAPGRNELISLADLEAYRPTIAKEMFDTGNAKKSDGTSGTMYDAIRASRPPKKKRGSGQRGQGQATGAAAAHGNDISIKNVAQYESAAAEEAAYIDTPGFKADWLKAVNAKDGGMDFLLSERAKYKFLDQMFGMNDGELMKKAGAELDARMTQAKATEVKAA